jgi:hypothetical protein
MISFFKLQSETQGDAGLRIYEEADVMGMIRIARFKWSADYNVFRAEKFEPVTEALSDDTWYFIVDEMGNSLTMPDQEFERAMWTLQHTPNAHIEAVTGWHLMTNDELGLPQSEAD